MEMNRFAIITSALVEKLFGAKAAEGYLNKPCPDLGLGGSNYTLVEGAQFLFGFSLAFTCLEGSFYLIFLMRFAWGVI